MYKSHNYSISKVKLTNFRYLNNALKTLGNIFLVFNIFPLDCQELILNKFRNGEENVERREQIKKELRCYTIDTWIWKSCIIRFQ